MTAAHSILAPSSAGRWVACPGSVRLEAMFPEDTESEAAREGIAAHWALAELLHGRAVAEGQITPDNFVLTAEQVQGAELHVDYLRRIIARHPGEPVQMFVEHRVDCHRVHGDCWGTLDTALWFPGIMKLYLPDFKFGHGWVEVFENWQLLTYLAGMLQTLQINGRDDQAVSVELGIVQPRSYHPDGAIRTWELMASDARPYINKLSMAADDALGPDPQLRVNPECDNCNARHACPALQANGLRGIDYSRKAVPFNLPPHALGLELAKVRDALAALKARETGLAGQAEALLTRGERVPFWTMERGQSRLAWNKPAAEVLALGQLLGVDLQKPVEPITPTQAKDKGLDAAILAAYADRPAGALKLVKQDDASARRIFS